LLLLTCWYICPNTFQMISDGHTFLNIDAQHVKASSPRLLTATIECAEDMLLIWDDVLNRLAAEQTDLLQDLGIEALDKLQVTVETFACIRLQIYQE
jgi:hypothetical protein